MMKLASKQNLRSLCCVVVASCLSACSTKPSIADFEASSHVTKLKQQFEVTLVADLSDETKELRKESNPELARNGEFLDAIKACGVQPFKTSTNKFFAPPALAISVLATAGEFAFNRYYEEKNKELERLKKAATPPAFVIQNFLDSGESLEKTKCLVVTTKEKHEGKLELRSISALKLVRVGQGKPAAFYLQPAYVRFGNSVAATRKLTVEGKEHPARIEVSFGLSIKSVGLDKTSGNSFISPAGEGVVSVSDVAAGPDAAAMQCQDNQCPRSDLIPYPGKGPVSLRVSMAEVGDVGFDIDDAIGQNKALAAAFGPVVKNVITGAAAGN